MVQPPAQEVVEPSPQQRQQPLCAGHGLLRNGERFQGLQQPGPGHLGLGILMEAFRAQPPALRRAPVALGVDRAGAATPAADVISTAGGAISNRRVIVFSGRPPELIIARST